MESSEDKRFFNRFMAGMCFLGLLSVAVPVGIDISERDERIAEFEAKKAAARAKAAENIATVAGENRKLMCQAVAAGQSIDAPSYVKVAKQGNFSNGREVDDPIALQYVYGMPKDCYGGLKPNDVIGVCNEIGFQISAQQIGASLDQSRDRDLKNYLSCLKTSR